VMSGGILDTARVARRGFRIGCCRIAVMEKVLFVCTANICRSPIAVGIFNALVEDRGLTFQAESAGTAALVGDPVASHTYQVARELGLDIDGHRARQVDETMLREAHFVLTMTPQHRDTLHRNFKDFKEKIYTLPEYSDGDTAGGIADPYGRSIGIYRTSAQKILHHVELVVERLERERTKPGSLIEIGQPPPVLDVDSRTTDVRNLTP
jgi:protein-tyrosine-phosphatase